MNEETTAKDASVKQVDPAKDASVKQVDRESEAKPKDYALLAKLCIRDGKPFYHSAIASGFSETTARRGLPALAEQSKAVSDAIKRESEALRVQVEKLKPLAFNRIYYEILDRDNGQNGLRAIEIAGKFKETDWFVRSTELNLGVFVGLSDSSAGENTPPEDTKE